MDVDISEPPCNVVPHGLPGYFSSTTPPDNAFSRSRGLVHVEAFRVLGCTLFARENLLMCTICKNAVTPSSCVQHAKRVHKLKLSEFAIQDFENACVERSIIVQAVDYPIPKPRQTAIPLLDIFAGIVCTLPGCDHACIELSSMIKHFECDTRHKQANMSEYIRENTWIQTLFRSPRRYFAVETLLDSDAPDDDVLTALFTDIIPSMPAIPILPANTERDRTPFMTAFKFDVDSEFIRANTGRRVVVKELKAVPKPTDVPFYLLHHLIPLYIIEAGKLGSSGPDHHLVCQHLFQGASITPTK